MPNDPGRPKVAMSIRSGRESLNYQVGDDQGLQQDSFRQSDFVARLPEMKTEKVLKPVEEVVSKCSLIMKRE